MLTYSIRIEVMPDCVPPHLESAHQANAVIVPDAKLQVYVVYFCRNIERHHPDAEHIGIPAGSSVPPKRFPGKGMILPGRVKVVARRTSCCAVSWAEDNSVLCIGETKSGRKE
jgi:hypothetical protein